MTVKKQDVSAVKTMFKQMSAARLTAFLTSLACAQQAGAEKTSFASKHLEKHHIADWTSVICVALGIISGLVLEASHVGRRYNGKNHEIEAKVLKATLETALW